MVVLKDSVGHVILRVDEKIFPLSMDVTTSDASVRGYQIKFSYVWDDVKKQKDRSRIRGAVMIGK